MTTLLELEKGKYMILNTFIKRTFVKRERTSCYYSNKINTGLTTFYNTPLVMTINRRCDVTIRIFRPDKKIAPN